MKQYNVGIYLRLSKDDGDNEESESITNQRKIILDYIAENEDMYFFKEYVDDGYSGSNFNRPGFKQMLKDIENNEIDIVITKNLARFGRNYIETGHYIEKYFPDHRVRYIAILDNIDNFEDSINNDFLPFMGVLNEKHCKDTSIAVKRSKRKRMEDGIYACNTAPFGYKKDPNNPGKLIVDEVSSKTVKKIFELKLQGLTCNQIVTYMEENNYQTPSQYMNIRGFEKLPNKDIWKRSSITKILGNKVYLGHSVRGKTQNISYKSKKRIHIKRNDFIIVENTHEALVTKEVFDKIHNTKKYGYTREVTENNHLLNEFIFCKDCGKRLIYKKRRDKVFIYCRNNSENSKLCSNNCRIDYDIIEDKIFTYIMNLYDEYINKSKNKDKLYKKCIVSNLQDDSKKIKDSEMELSNINNKISSLYSQRLSGKIKEDDYKERYEALSKKRKIITEELETKQNKFNIEKNKIDSIGKKRELFSKLRKIDKNNLKIEDIRKLIEKIEVLKNEIYIKFTFNEIGTFNHEI